jgi:translation initiation factor IF-2
MPTKTSTTAQRETKTPRKKTAAAPVESPAVEAPAAPVETLSLIDPVAKKPRRTKAASGFTALAPMKKTALGKKEEAAAPEAEEIPPAPAEPEPEVVAVEVPTEEAPPVEDAKIIHLKPPIIVKDLAAAMGLKSFQLIHDLMEQNIFASINQNIEPDVAGRLCEKHGFVFEKERREKGAGVHKVEVVIEPPPEPELPPENELKARAPIITMMGHVDHGKTSLLDTIRRARVAAGEAGGITQHIGAYSIVRNGQPITFLDTPGHAAFTSMRARGANVTDIVVLVVAADDGLMPQTIEAINHAKAAQATIIVAINKIDLPSANPDKVKTQLQEKGLTPEDWGGDTICCPVSATKGTGVDELLSMILLQAEVLELRASDQVEPRGVVIEAEIEQGRGPTATVIVKMGTMKVGQSFICGNYWGKIKQLIDDQGKPIKQAGPATPVKILGFSGLPNAGDELVIMDSERSARTLSEERLNSIRLNKLAAPQRATLENLFASTGEQKKELRVVVKADVQGSLEALVASLKEIPSTKISLEIIHSAVGPISESDVLLASASDAVIIGFGIKVESSAATAAKREGVQIKLYSIIYELLDQVKEAMAGLLDPELRETVIGHAEVKQVFELSKGKVAGCMVVDGRIARTARARVLRRRQPIYDGGLATLRRFQDDVKEVRAGLECGIKLGDFNDYEIGDTIQCYQLEKVAQQL